jgi:hypothetical protein
VTRACLHACCLARPARRETRGPARRPGTPTGMRARSLPTSVI